MEDKSILKLVNASKLVDTTKWLIKQTKTFIPSLILIIFIGIISALLDVLTAIASKNMIDLAIAKEKNSVIIALVIFCVAVLTQVCIRAFYSSKLVHISENYSKKIRLSLYSNIVKSNWSDFTKYHSDDILTRLTSDISIVTSGIIEVIPNIIVLGIQLILSFFALFYYDRVLAVLAIILGPFSLIFYKFFRRKLKELHIKIQEAEGLYRAYLHECIQNTSILKVFSLEEKSSKKISQLQENRIKLVLKRNRINIITSSILSLGYYVGFILSFAWGAFRLSQGLITFGTLTVFFQLVGQVQGPFVSIARSIPQLIATEGSASRLIELENLSSETEKNNTVSIKKAGIEFDNLEFQYKKDKPLIKNVNATINPGEVVAIIGPSGEGKTTLVRLILSLLEHNSGKINIFDENSTYNIEPSFRSMISYVPQGNTLFSGTILENIIVGKPDATEEEVVQALKDASAYEFVKDLKEGINSIIGQRGIGLSEGQAQRLTIARALLKKAPILILDEATSALDEETELNILNAIKGLQPRPTCLFITHRPTVYNLMDRVLRLKDGVLIEIQ